MIIEEKVIHVETVMVFTVKKLEGGWFIKIWKLGILLKFL